MFKLCNIFSVFIDENIYITFISARKTFKKIRTNNFHQSDKLSFVVCKFYFPSAYRHLKVVSFACLSLCFYTHPLLFRKVLHLQSMHKMYEQMSLLRIDVIILVLTFTNSEKQASKIGSTEVQKYRRNQRMISPLLCSYNNIELM